MKLGIIGLPQSGKTTIFNALTNNNFPIGQMSGGGRVETRTAVVDVPDPRIDRLSAMFNPQKTIYAKVTYVDIAGVEATSGQGFSGQLRNELAQMDGLLHVVRVFDNPNVPHINETVNPARDVAAVESELILNDLITVERRLERLAEELKKGGGRDKALIQRDIDLFERFKTALEAETPLRVLPLSAEEEKSIGGYGFLSRKPMLILFNCDETIKPIDALLPPGFEIGLDRHLSAAVLQGAIEMEISQLPPEDADVFLAEYGITEPGASRIIKLSYELLRVQSFFTVGEDEVRAWTVEIGASAPEAAGKIHTDLQKGFIRAEVMTYDDLIAGGSVNALKATGKLRLEGKEYIVQDGDILNIRFSPPGKK